MIVDIKESIVSLLVKLHSKLSGKPNSYVPLGMREGATGHSESRIGDGPHFIGVVLDKVSEASLECAHIIEDTYQAGLPKTPKKSPKGLDKEERRRRARERQQKLMEDFAAKQKTFMEQAMGSEGML